MSVIVSQMNHFVRTRIYAKTTKNYFFIPTKCTTRNRSHWSLICGHAIDAQVTMSTLSKSMCGHRLAVMLGQHFQGMLVLTGIRATDMTVWLNVFLKNGWLYHGGRMEQIFLGECDLSGRQMNTMFLLLFHTLVITIYWNKMSKLIGIQVKKCRTWWICYPDKS